MTELTFERFIPTTRSREAFDVAKAFAGCDPDAPRLLALRGRPGVGKSHLMHAIAAADASRCHVVVTTAAQLADLLVAAVRDDSLELLRRRYKAGDLLMVEDLQVLSTKPATQQLLASLLTTWIAAGVRVAVTIGAPRRWLADFENGIPSAPISRVVLLQPPSRRDTRAIILAMAKRTGVSVEREGIDAIAAWCAGDVRRAVGAIQQLKFGRVFELERERANKEPNVNTD